MENKLKSMFEFQRFNQNSRLAKMIEDTEAKYGTALSDEDLDFVAAAGEFDIDEENSDKK